MKKLFCIGLYLVLATGTAFGADHSVKSGVYVEPFSQTDGSNYRLQWVNIRPEGEKKFYVLKLIVHVKHYGHCEAKLRLMVRGISKNGDVLKASLVNLFDDFAVDPCFIFGKDEDVELRLPRMVYSLRNLKEVELTLDGASPKYLSVPSRPTDGDSD